MIRMFLTSAIALLVSTGTALAGGTCTFTSVGSIMQLDGNCMTDESITVPNGMTLDGQGFTITAVDPAGDHFRGGVIENGGALAHVTNLGVTTSGLANACDAGADRLRGILFDGASGSITHSVVSDINQGSSGCQEGNGIEIRNAPFDGTHPATVSVTVQHNVVTDWQKTGILANGDVDVEVSHNKVGSSATQDDLAANSVQFGFGALGAITQNEVGGNEWRGTSFFAASAILVFSANGPDVVNNRIMEGNSDIAIFVVSDNSLVDNNKIHDQGDDNVNSCCDIGIGNYGTDNTVTNNKVRGFDLPIDGPDEGDNKTIPDPNKPGS